MADAHKHSSILGSNWVVGRKLSRLLKGHGANERRAVLDLGCGSSPFRTMFADCENYIRVDRASADPGVVIADAAALPMASNSVGVVLLLQVLGDLTDLGKVLAEVERVLTPGGKVLVCETMAYPEHDLPHDYWRVLPQGLIWVVEQTKLTVVSIEYLGGPASRFALLWNTYLMGALERYRVLWPLAAVGRLICNLISLAAEKLLGQSCLSSDYFAHLEKPPTPERATAVIS